MDYCDCHKKHSKQLDTLEKSTEDNHSDHGEMWTAIKSKISMNWIFVLIPAFVVWIGFQVALYDSIKNIDKKVAVIQTKLELQTK